jgi:hypothetical protein
MDQGAPKSKEAPIVVQYCVGDPRLRHAGFTVNPAKAGKNAITTHPHFPKPAVQWSAQLFPSGVMYRD